MMLVILLNVATMAMDHAGESAAWQDATSWANVAFTAAFVAEAALKLVAIGATLYFKVRGGAVCCVYGVAVLPCLLDAAAGAWRGCVHAAALRS